MISRSTRRETRITRSEGFGVRGGLWVSLVCTFRLLDSTYLTLCSLMRTKERSLRNWQGTSEEVRRRACAVSRRGSFFVSALVSLYSLPRSATDVLDHSFSQLRRIGSAFMPFGARFSRTLSPLSFAANFARSYCNLLLGLVTPFAT